MDGHKMLESKRTASDSLASRVGHEMGTNRAQRAFPLVRRLGMANDPKSFSCTNTGHKKTRVEAGFVGCNLLILIWNLVAMGTL